MLKIGCNCTGETQHYGSHVKINISKITFLQNFGSVLKKLFIAFTSPITVHFQHDIFACNPFIITHFLYTLCIIKSLTLSTQSIVGGECTQSEHFTLNLKTCSTIML